MKQRILLWAVLLGAVIMVSGQDWLKYIPDSVKEIATKLDGAKVCSELLIQPLTVLILPNNVSYAKICQSDYFAGCHDEFVKRCTANMNCSSSPDNSNDYQRWLQAFANGGKNYTCGLGMDKIAATFKNGGYNCLAKVSLQLLPKTTQFVAGFWEANYVKCNDIASRIYAITNPLATCENKELYEEVNGYFYSVVQQSPCNGAIEIDYSAAPKGATLSFILILNSVTIVKILH